MRLGSKLLLPALALALSAGVADSHAHRTTPRGEPPTDGEVRNVLLLIVDGAGAGAWAAAHLARDDLAVGRMPVAGMMHTPSGSDRVTDSAAGATVLATGERVTNRTVGVAAACPVPVGRENVSGEWPPECERLPGWFAAAAENGKARGIVTTTSVVDATPAAFIAHSPSRYWLDAIAEQYASADLDVLMGGGSQYFSAETRTDGRDLLTTMCSRADCVTTQDALEAYSPTSRPLIGLFAPADLDAVEPRPTHLPDMVRAALSRLERAPNGFVAMFESESVDNATHSHADLETVTKHMLEFDDAVAVALDFADRVPGTLVIVTSDHETGGLSLAKEGDDVDLRYTTGGHTAAWVPLFAAGPGAERFGGLRGSDEIGRELWNIVDGW